MEWEEALAVAALRIQRGVDYDAIAFYTCRENQVSAKYVGGDDRSHFQSKSVRLGEGLVGWVADTGKPILNGNPAVDTGHTLDGGFASALALPLTHANRVIGVVALYRRERDAFAADELVTLLEPCPAVASLLLEAEEDGNPFAAQQKLAELLA